MIKKPKLIRIAPKYVMAIDVKYLNKFISVTEKAAIGSSFFIGKKKDKIAADQGAVDKMRTELNKISNN